ncbi:MAG: LysM peptidoglycan-binding domain-containing protein [Firmicutes bacterium]|nr:LysM peptidoglycan-binding domain-containing protein [Bacillota bacterium]
MIRYNPPHPPEWLMYAMVLLAFAMLIVLLLSLGSHPTPEVGGSSLTLAYEAEYVDVWQVYGLEAIPVASSPHVVRPGEQLFHVAIQHRLPGPVQMTVDIIKALNNLWDRPLLRPGQKLRVPETDPRHWPLAVQKIWEKARGL